MSRLRRLIRKWRDDLDYGASDWQRGAANAKTVENGPIGFDHVSGLTFFEVPEPSAATMLALGALAGAAQRRRRRTT